MPSQKRSSHIQTCIFNQQNLLYGKTVSINEAPLERFTAMTKKLKKIILLIDQVIPSLAK